MEIRRQLTDDRQVRHGHFFALRGEHPAQVGVVGHVDRCGAIHGRPADLVGITDSIVGRETGARAETDTVDPIGYFPTRRSDRRH